MKVSFLRTTPLLFVLVSTVTFAEVSIRAPDIAENGSVVPIEAYFSPALSKGESATVLIDGNKAMVLDVVDGDVKKLSTRFKMNAGNVVIKRSKGGKISESAERNVRISVGARIGGAPTNINKRNGFYKERIASGVYKALATSENGFGNTLVLEDNGFKISLTGSNMVSKNPYIAIEGTFTDRVSSVYVDKALSEYENVAGMKTDIGTEEKQAQSTRAAEKITDEKQAQYIQNTRATEKIMSDWLGDVKNMFNGGGGATYTPPTKYTRCSLKCRNGGLLHDVRDLGVVAINASNDIERDIQIDEICLKLNPGRWYKHSSQCN